MHTDTLDTVIALLEADRSRTHRISDWTGERAADIDATFDRMVADVTSAFDSLDAEMNDAADWATAATTGVPMF